MIPTVEFHDLEELTQWIISRTQGERSVIAIDGFTDSGKTTLSAAIAEKTGLSVLHLDDFVVQQLGDGVFTYADTLNFHALKTEISKVGSLIVEGVTVREILRQLQITQSLDVYVKRLNSEFEWQDALELTIPHPIDAYVSPSKLRVLVRNYHRANRPHEQSDAIFSWIEP
ncbi:hypothetical protein [Caulobacter sp. DWR1-3-2b1]|uniref:hypothetical protein n=1 Tax=Caulobacter sp. DWR1-3-2b1 TaxID=2804670 RepID=UPI003CF5E7CD